MTKYEWEKELKKQLFDLSAEEQRKIFDYYDEIFEDRFESGMTEADIIREFGNPYDVAQKILADRTEPDIIFAETGEPNRHPFQNIPSDTGRPSPAAPPQTHSDGNTPERGSGTRNFAASPQATFRTNGASGERKATVGDTAARVCLVVVLYLFVGLPLLIVFFSLAVTGAALFLSGFAVILAGFVDFFYFLGQILLQGATGGLIAHLGIGLGLSALGFLLTPLFLYLTKVLFKGCDKIFVLTKRIVTGKKEGAAA